MQKYPFSFIATAFGLFILGILIIGAPETAGGEPKFPLLFMLLASELGFLVTAAGAFTGTRSTMTSGIDKYVLTSVICCALMSIKFALVGIAYWPL